MLHDFESNLSGLQKFHQRFVLDPARWRGFVPVPPLNWQSVRFSAEARADIPQQRGIYAFVLQFQDHVNGPLPLPMHGYILYAGITGHIGAERTLRDRYGDYLRDKRRAKRRRIHHMLNLWPDDLYFHYSVVDDAVELDKLELALNDAMIPPFVTNDFSAEVRPLVNVLRGH